MWLPWAWVIFVGCRADCEPRIDGGTEEQQAKVLRAVDVFLDRLAPELQVCVPRVSLSERPADKGAAGLYRSGSRRIFLKPGSIDLVTFHEYCHAVQHQNDLATRPTYDLDPSFVSFYQLEGDSDSLASEGFAHSCSNALGWSALLGPACPSDSTDLGPLRAAQELFLGPDPDLIRLDSPVRFEELLRSPDPEPFEVMLLPPTGVRFLRLTGTTDLALPELGPLPPPTPEPVPLGNFETATVMGAQIGKIWVDSPDGARAFRRAWLQDGRFSPLGCWQANERTFAFDEEIWSAYLDGGDFVVGRWVPAD